MTSFLISVVIYSKFFISYWIKQIDDVYDQFQKLGIDIELIHAESASGQLELVLPYLSDVIKLADNIIFAKEVSQIIYGTVYVTWHILNLSLTW